MDTEMKTSIKNIGQLFIVGFKGREPSRPFLNFLAEERIGGVIFFADNCPDHDQTRHNIELIRQATGDQPPIIAIDQEGGRVCRIKGAPAEFHSPWSYGRSRDVEHFREDYRRSAMYMESLGISLNFAPVADVLTNARNTVLSDRCFGQTPDAVAPFVRASVTIARRAGLLSCLKHFPGLGAASFDPHEKTAELEFNVQEWRDRDRLPFAAGIEEGADLVMTSHVMLRTFDDDQMATASPRVVQELLRNDLGYDGAVITDDLLMEGAAALGNVGQRAIKAFQAGHDMLLFSQDAEAAMHAYDLFCDAVNRGDIEPARIQASLSRVAGLKFRLRNSVIP